MNLRKTKMFLSFKLRRLTKTLIWVFSKIKIFFGKLRQAIKLLTVTEKRIILICLLVFAVGLILVGRKNYYNMTIASPAVGGKVSIAEIGEPKLINPLFAQSFQDSDIVRLVFSGLLSWNSQRELVPDLARKWQISEDKKVYTFHLSPKAQWHDDMPVVADDVIFTTSLISDPNYSGPLKGLFENVIFEKVDDHTVRFILKEPYAPFLSNLTFGILPFHILGNVPLDEIENDSFNLFPIGTGPYRLKDGQNQKSKNQIILERNNKYFGHPALISELVINYYDDFSQSYKAYQKGEVSVLVNVSYNSIEQIQQSKDLKLYKMLPSSYTALFFNLSNDLLKDESFRETIATAINRKEIIDQVISGQGQPIIGPILPDYLGYTDQVKKISYNPELAKTALKNAGYSDNNSDGVYQKKKTKLEFNLVTSDQENFVKIAEIVKEQLAQIKIKINIITADPLAVQTDYIFGRKFDLLLFGENLGPDPDPYSFWHSSQIGLGKMNLAGFSSSKIDSLLEEARINSDLNIRKEKYQEFQKIIAEEVPAVFLFRPINLWAADNSIKGIKDAKGVIASDKFYQLVQWYVKIGRRKK